MWRLAAAYVLLWCVVLWWVLLGCVLLWCDVVLCYAVFYGRRNLTKNPSLKLSGMKRKLVYSKMEKVCIHRKNELPHVQHQQAISIYFFLEGLGFRV